MHNFTPDILGFYSELGIETLPFLTGDISCSEGTEWWQSKSLDGIWKWHEDLSVSFLCFCSSYLHSHVEAMWQMAVMIMNYLEEARSMWLSQLLQFPSSKMFYWLQQRVGQ